MARSSIKAESESDVTQPLYEALDFDDVTLRGKGTPGAHYLHYLVMGSWEHLTVDSVF